MKSTDILDTFLEALNTPEFTKIAIDSIDALLSGEIYEKFMTAELTPEKLPHMIAMATPCLDNIDFLSDQVLSELTPELRERVLNYLERLRYIYDTAISMVKDRVRTTVPKQKKPEEMSREELLEYIKTQLKD